MVRLLYCFIVSLCYHHISLLLFDIFATQKYTNNEAIQQYNHETVEPFNFTQN